MYHPLFSIVIANYNYGRFLEDALKSIFSQSCQDFEVIVVDGGSKDNSVEIIKKYAGGIAWWCSEPDKGQSNAFNKGFSHAKGRFLTWLNADDILLRGALAAVAGKINQNPECQWFVGSSVWLNEDFTLRRCFRAHRFSRLRAKIGLISANGPSSFFSHYLLDAVGGIDEALHFVMDIDLWNKFYFMQGVTYVRTTYPVWGYRIHAHSKTGGLDVNPQDAINIRNHTQRMAEGKILGSRYQYRAVSPIKHSLFLLFGGSLTDFCVSRWDSIRFKGRSVEAYEDEADRRNHL